MFSVPVMVAIALLGASFGVSAEPRSVPIDRIEIAATMAPDGGGHNPSASARIYCGAVESGEIYLRGEKPAAPSQSVAWMLSGFVEPLTASDTGCVVTAVDAAGAESAYSQVWPFVLEGGRITAEIDPPASGVAPAAPAYVVREITQQPGGVLRIDIAPAPMTSGAP